MADLPREPSDRETYSARRERQLIQYVRSITPRSSNTCRVRRTTGGITLQPTAKSTKQRSSGASTPTKYHPFQIIDTSTTTVPQVRVTSGTFHSVYSASGSISIQNLMTDMAVTVDSLVFLYNDTNLGEWGVTVDRLSSPTYWTNYPNIVTITGTAPDNTLDKWFKLVGYVSTTIPADQDTTPGFSIEINGSDHWVYQCLFTNLAAQDICYSGTPINYPYPWSGAGPAA